MFSLALSSLFYVTVNTNEKKTEKLFLAVNFSQCLQLGTDVRGVLHQKKALELQNALIKVRRSILDSNFAILAIKNYSLPGFVLLLAILDSLGVLFCNCVLIFFNSANLLVWFILFTT